MQEPEAVPTRRTCQYGKPSGKLCRKELQGRGPRQRCSIHRQLVRCAQNRENKRNQRAKDDNHQSELNRWFVFTHRLRYGKKIISRRELFERLAPYLQFPRLKNLLHSLRVEQEVHTAVVDFHAFTPDGRWAFTFTIFGPNSSGYEAGMDHLVELEIEGCKRFFLSFDYKAIQMMTDPWLVPIYDTVIDNIAFMKTGLCLPEVIPAFKSLLLHRSSNKKVRVIWWFRRSRKKSLEIQKRIMVKRGSDYFVDYGKGQNFLKPTWRWKEPSREDSIS